MARVKRFVRVHALVSLVFATAWGCGGATVASEAIKKDAGHDAAQVFGPVEASVDVYILPPQWSGTAAKVLASGVDGIGVATDGVNVYAQGAGGAIFACPVGGCPGGTATQLSAIVGSSDDLQTIVASAGVATFLTTEGTSISSVAFARPNKTSTTLETTATLGALVTDDTNIYFVSSAPTDGGPSVNSLMSCPLTGTCTAPTTLYAPGENSDIYGFGAIAVSGGVLYFVAEGQNTSIEAVATTGGSTRTVCTSSMLEGVESIVVAGGHVYFTSSSDPSSVYQCPTSGGNPSVFIEDYSPYALATDGTNVYWTNYVPMTGTVATCAASARCTAPFTIADMQDSPFAIAASTTGVYWTTGTTIVGASK